jgi:hypothetical protein
MSEDTHEWTRFRLRIYEEWMTSKLILIITMDK